MLSEIAVPLLATCAVLLVPGYLALRSFGVPRLMSVCCAPLLSVVLIYLLGQAYALVGISSSPVLILLPIVIVPLAVLAVQRAGDFKPRSTMPQISPWLVILAVVLGCALGYNLFLSRLSSADAMLQSYDLTEHVNLIQSMAESGSFSSLNTSFYLSEADQAINPYSSSGSFYPAAWHVFCALIVQITGASTPTVITTTLYAFCAIVYPLGMLAFLSVIFRNRSHVVVCGAICTLAFVSFPWMLLVFGPVYPNVIGFATMPVAMTFFVQAFDSTSAKGERPRMVVLLLLAAVGLAFLHPNTIFSCILILAPWCVGQIWSACGRKCMATVKKLAFCLLFVAFCVAFWLFCYNLPLFESTVTHVWDRYANAFQELVNILSQTYTMGIYVNSAGEVATQFVLAALVIVGAVVAAHSSEDRWVLVSYLLACATCFVSATSEGELKQILSGFWYTDTMRLASMASIAAVPLAALGAEWVYSAVLGLAERYNDARCKATHPTKIAVILTGLFLLLNFMPGFNLPGLHYQYTATEAADNYTKEFRDWAKSVHTTFGDYRATVDEVYSYNTPLSSDEQEFLDGVEQIVDDGSLIINNPMDGSFLAYGTTGLRIYYRNFSGFGTESETATSELIRTSLCDIATNEEVQEAVESLGARYVIVMDDSIPSFIDLRGDYEPERFTGISGITEDTPGFTLIYQLNGCYLYEITV